MTKTKIPVTPALRILKNAKVDFETHLYDYQEHGGTSVASKSLGVDEHAVIKTLIMEDDSKRPLIVLMNGDKEVSTKALARIIGVKAIEPCDPKTANRHSGYIVGGTSPFGVKKLMPVYMERNIAELPVVYINGGKRGFLLEMKPEDLILILKPEMVEVAV